MIWPWSDGKGNRMHWRDVLNSRRFSVIYLLIIALLFALFGLGSRTCPIPSDAVICDFVMRPYNLFEAPHVFVFTLFSSFWFHNNPDHILLTAALIVVFLQTAEIRIGTKRAMIAVFGIHALVVVIMTLYLYAGDYLNPGTDWYEFGLRGRNYMGGSVGLFGVSGVLFSQIKRPIAGALFYFGFEFWNAYIYEGAALYVSMGHVTAFTLGFVLGRCWLHRDGKRFKATEFN
tara:strand:+ start:79 stop:771 length:693 start_codon:yes stop_codon:yes gene_type:complete